MKHVVMFSGGIGSYQTAKRVIAAVGTENVFLLFSDVKGNTENPHIGEDEDTYRFIEEAAAFLGVELVKVVDGRDIWQVFKDKKFLGNTRLAPCSSDLKQKPAKKWIHENTDPDDTLVYVGIDWSEIHRLPAVERGYAPWRVAAPMTVEPKMTKADMLADCEADGIKPPRLYEMGFKHNNCGGGCVRAGQAQFKLLLEKMPERYAEWERQEENIQDFLGVPVTILRDRRGGSVKPLSLTQLRENLQSNPTLFDATDEGVACNCVSSWSA